MTKRPKKKAGEGYGYKVGPPIAGYDDQTGKCYRVTKVNRKGTVTALKPIKPRKRIKARSDSLRARALRELYEETKALFKAPYVCCAACSANKIGAAAEPHHIRGRAGTLLIDRRFIRALCATCHKWVHDNPGMARVNGWIAGAGEWNTPPRDAESSRLNGLILDRINAIGERIKKRVAKKPEGK